MIEHILSFPNNPSSDLLETLRKRFVKDDIKVLKTCMCGNLFLLESSSDVDIQERVAASAGEQDPAGDLYWVLEENTPIDFSPFQIDKLFNPIEIPSVNIHPSERTSLVRSIDESKKGVIVAIVDSGFDPYVDALRDYIWVNPTLQIDNCINDGMNGVDVFNENSIVYSALQSGHGTAIAGMVAGLPEGVYPEKIELQLMNVKFTKNQKGTLFDAICGMYYALEKEADIILTCWGARSYHSDSALNTVIEAALSDNVMIVAATGNGGNNIGRFSSLSSSPMEPSFYPAGFGDEIGYPNVIAVGAYGNNFTRSEFSNFGIDELLAPGEAIEVITPDSERNHGHMEMDGTSIAAPYVARWVSIIKANNPDYSIEEIKNKLREEASNYNPPILIEGN